MRAIAIKELRETIGIAAVALIPYAGIVASAMGIDSFSWLLGNAGGRLDNAGAVPFAGGTVLMQLGVISVGLAIAVGLRQSAWEAMRGTYLFLLHRPTSRNQIFLAKLLVGLALVQFTAALPIVGYAAWAALPATHASPFELSMMAPAWTGWLCLPVVYLGAFLTGVLPGRWLGTRLLPTAATVAVFM
ncbi:MAG TPA: hypothetical protein VMF30_17750, partial [Pirellulales bacterium]|nr:hypothetical protein [Pirellulales bacterium]